MRPTTPTYMKSYWFSRYSNEHLNEANNVFFGPSNKINSSIMLFKVSGYDY